MSKDLNKVQLIGRLGANPEMKFTPQGSAVTTFRVAVNGYKEDDVQWFTVIAWQKIAEVCNQHLSKGSRVYIEGRLQTRKWEDDAGNKREKTEIVISDMIMLDKKSDQASIGQTIPDDEIF